MTKNTKPAEASGGRGLGQIDDRLSIGYDTIPDADLSTAGALFALSGQAALLKLRAQRSGDLARAAKHARIQAYLLHRALGLE